MYNLVFLLLTYFLILFLAPAWQHPKIPHRRQQAHRQIESLRTLQLEAHDVKHRTGARQVPRRVTVGQAVHITSPGSHSVLKKRKHV